MPGAGPLTVTPNDTVAASAWAAPGGGPGNPQELNRYSYALNNPARYTDPSGHCIGILAGLDTLTCVAVIGTGAVLIAGALIAVGSSPNGGVD